MKLTKIRIPTFWWNSRLGITTMSPLSRKYFHKNFWVGNELSFNTLGTQLSQCKGISSKEMQCIQYDLWSNSVTFWNHILVEHFNFILIFHPFHLSFGGGKWPGLSREVDEFAGFPWQLCNCHEPNRKPEGLKCVGWEWQEREDSPSEMRVQLKGCCWGHHAGI